MNLKRLMREYGMDVSGFKRMGKDSCENRTRLIWFINVKMGFTSNLIDDWFLKKVSAL
jgi:hypothetical protein